MQVEMRLKDITDEDRLRVMDQLKNIEGEGISQTSLFEGKVASFIGTKYAVVVNSGMGGIHLALKALGIGERDEVILSPFAFVNAVSAVLHEKVMPIFVDIDPQTLNVDPDKIAECLSKIKDKKQEGKVKAIIPSHILGYPCDMDRIMEIANKYELKVIEDACEAFGSEWCSRRPTTESRQLKSITNSRSSTTPIKSNNWEKVGSFGKCGIFSFESDSQITMGEGGMIVTNDSKLAESCRYHREGSSYAVSDIACPLGVSQLERIDEIVAKREKIARAYNERLKGIKEIKIPYVAPNVKMSWFGYIIQLEDRFTKGDRDRVLEGLRAKGIGCNEFLLPVHLQPFYIKIFGEKSGKFPVTEKVSARTIALPFHNSLTESQIDYVVDNLKKLLRTP